jgi:hypothetical protein
MGLAAAWLETKDCGNRPQAWASPHPPEISRLRRRLRRVAPESTREA